jgi:hypothetical protein
VTVQTADLPKMSLSLAIKTSEQANLNSIDLKSHSRQSKTIDMSLFILKESTDAKIIGRSFPQTEIINIDASDGLDILSENKGLRIENLEPIDNVKFSNGAKLTDVVSCSLGAGGDIIVSKKFVSVLRQFGYSSVQLFPMKILYRTDTLEDYFWCHFVYEFEKGLDFQKSVYDNKRLPEINDQKPLNYPDYQGLVSRHSKYNDFRLIKTVLNKTYPFDDLFVLGYPNQNIYLSKRLQEALRDTKISGLDIVPAKNIYIS